jgi:hypothetical protein
MSKRSRKPFKEEAEIDPLQNLPWWIPKIVIEELRRRREQHE